MQFNIIMPYRPLCQGGRNSPDRELHQLSDGRWINDAGNALVDDDFRTRVSLRLALNALEKNSFFEHKIKIMIDRDVYPNKDFLKEYRNIEIIKTDCVPPKDIPPGAASWCWRLSAADKAGVESVPDDEWLCYSYVADLICCKNWDKFIVDAIEKYGEGYVYVPMFVELKGGGGDIPWGILGAEPTPSKIWKQWRREHCCHGLTLPDPGKGYILESDFDRYIEIANEAKMGLIIEPCGKRSYGYYSILVMKAKHAKSVGVRVGPGFDLDFDNRLYSEGHFEKVVVTNSFVLHNHFSPFYWTEEEARETGIRSRYPPGVIEEMQQRRNFESAEKKRR